MIQDPQHVVTVFDVVDKGGPTAVLLVLFLWFARWLPKYLEKQGDRQEKMLAVFQQDQAAARLAAQQEQTAEREACDRRFKDMFELIQGRRPS